MRHKERRVGCKEERERERARRDCRREKERETERRANRIERVAGQGERRRRQVYSGDLDANERFEALFDIRHDFIKHSSNVQTLYIELYSRSLGRLSLVPAVALENRPCTPRSAAVRCVCLLLSRSLSLPLSKTYRMLPCGGTAYNENIVPEELSRARVMPQYRIMYNYITAGEGARMVTESRRIRLRTRRGKRRRSR